MKCPRKCGGELRSVIFPDLGGAEIHLCPECEGGWYPHGSLSVVGQTSTEELQASELAVSLVGDKLEKIDIEADVECPVCSQVMSRFSYTLAPQVKIDECFDHGTWLDDGELGTISQSIASSTADMAQYRQGIKDMRKEMDMDGVAKGSSILNPFAVTIRLLNSMFSKPKG